MNCRSLGPPGPQWEETKNTGVCDGIMKLFLLQSKLSPSTTHYGFFQRVMTLYLKHIESVDSVYGGLGEA